MERYRPDFVLSEVVLHGENGFEYCAFQKRNYCRVPVALLSAIRLASARNLAMWAGADAYLTKPITGRSLYRTILMVALRVAERVAQAESRLGGTGITFTCKCGRQLVMGAQNAGRASLCPGCRGLVRCPEAAIDFGLMFRQMREESRNSSIGSAGIVCRSCRRTVDPLKCRVRDHFQCCHCESELQISPNDFEKWEMFFSDSQPEPAVTTFSPLEYVYVSCERCQTYHQYFSPSDQPMPCPRCGQIQSLPSVRGAPLSRAALNASGRLFEIQLPRNVRRLFLLPSNGRVSLGYDERNAVRLKERNIRSKHCFLRMTLDGPEIFPATQDARLEVNHRMVSDHAILQPDDLVRLTDDVYLRLLGNRRQSDSKLISSIQRDFKDHDVIQGAVEFSKPGSEIIQLHWEQQREKWRQHERKRHSTESAADE